jgi:ABC-type uncharacterized transport system involved in gliding motility auxiliary subunit
LLVFPAPAWACWVTGILGAAGAGAYAGVERRKLLALVLSPRMRYGTNALVFTLAVAAVVALLNVIATRHSWRSDLTSNRFYSLSDQTRKVVKGLKRKVKVTAFFRSGTPETAQLRDLLREYRHLSTQIDFEFVDPDSNPARASNYRISSYNTTVIETGTGTEIKRKDIQPQEMFGYQFQGRQPQQEFKGETAMTSALVSLGESRQRTVYFVEGHGERSVNDPAEAGFSSVKAGLESDNYVVRTVNLLREGKVPADADLVVVAGPKKVVPEPERKLLADYLGTENGRMLVLLDTEASAGLEPVIAQWGLKSLPGYVVDRASFYAWGGWLTPIPAYRPHEITRDLEKQGVGSVFPGTRGLEIGTIGTGTVVPLLESSDDSWLERNIKAEAKSPKFSAGTDRKGPVAIAAAVALNPRSEPKGPDEPPAAANPVPKLVVFASADFVTNNLKPVSGGNFDLFANSVGWLLGSDAGITIRPKQQDTRRIVLDNVKSRFMGVTAILLTPLAVLGLGGWRWWRRRSL